MRKVKIAQLKTRDQASDWLGILSSGLCLLHCLIAPLVLVLQLGFAAHHHPPWHYLDYAFLIISFIACYITTKKCILRRLAVLLWSFFGLLALSVLLHHAANFLEYTAYLASAGLVTCHLLNIRYCRKCHQKAF